MHAVRGFENPAAVLPGGGDAGAAGQVYDAAAAVAAHHAGGAVVVVEPHGEVVDWAAFEDDEAVGPDAVAAVAEADDLLLRKLCPAVEGAEEDEIVAGCLVFEKFHCTQLFFLDETFNVGCGAPGGVFLSEQGPHIVVVGDHPAAVGGVIGHAQQLTCDVFRSAVALEQLAEDVPAENHVG